MLEKSKDPEFSLVNYLMQYRATPHTTTGKTPAELFLGRNYRTRMHLLHSTVGDRVQMKQRKQKENYDKKTRDRNCEVGDTVWTKTPFDLNWKKGIVLRKKTDHSVDLELEDASLKRRHLDQTKPGEPSSVSTETGGSPMGVQHNSADHQVERHQPSQEEENVPVPNLRRSSRTRRLPERLAYQDLGGERGRCSDL